MRFDVITLFPELFAPFLEAGIVRRAYASGQIELKLWNPREHAEGNYRRVDDRPFGGGPGMVMMAEPLARCLAAVRSDRGEEVPAPGGVVPPLGGVPRPPASLAPARAQAACAGWRSRAQSGSAFPPDPCAPPGSPPPPCSPVRARPAPPPSAPPSPQPPPPRSPARRSRPSTSTRPASPRSRWPCRPSPARPSRGCSAPSPRRSRRFR